VEKTGSPNVNKEPKPKSSSEPNTEAQKTKADVPAPAKDEAEEGESEDAETEEGEVEEGEVEEKDETTDRPKEKEGESSKTEVDKPKDKKAVDSTKMDVEEPNEKVKEDDTADTKVESKIVDEPEEKPAKDSEEKLEIKKPKQEEATPMEVDETTTEPPKETKTKSKEQSKDKEELPKEAKSKAKEKPRVKAESKKEPKPKAKEESKAKEERKAIASEHSAIPEKKKADSGDEEGEIKDDTDEEGEIKESEEEGEIKEDQDMDDVQSQSDAGDAAEATTEETASVSADADMASTDGDMASVAEDNKKSEPSYSTRGRASGTTTPVPRDVAKSGTSGSDQWERSVREALEDLGRAGKEGLPAGVGAGGSSFLEALGEEERRTRTRYLPAVEGIHMLRKNEIKSDMALARSAMSSAGSLTTVAAIAAGALARKSKGGKKKQDSSAGEPEAMDTEDGDASPPSEDDPASDVGVRIGNTSTIEINSYDVLVAPSSSFVPPPAATQSSSISAPNNDKKEEAAPSAPTSSSVNVKGILNNQSNIKSPSVVESVMAFNPPRPPESIGKKKQHRMLRWERRPADVEVDLNNYRKTVDRTRKELHTAELELERIEATSDHLRRHFFGHLRCMDQESEQIMDELTAVQQQCISAADLLTSRTRSRGAGKGSYVMRDVLGVLKARGTELNEKGLHSSALASSDGATSSAGIGGVGAVSFVDWDQHTVVTPQRIASAWVLPGDRVETPCGEGVVLKIVENTTAEETPKQLKSGGSPSKTDIDDSPTKNASSSPAAATRGSSGKKIAGATDTAESIPENFLSSPSPTICVRFPFGVGYFSLASVKSKENPNTFSDAQLVKRWRGILETATKHAGLLDVAGMATLVSALGSHDVADPDDPAQSGTAALEEATNGGSTNPLNMEVMTNGGEDASDSQPQDSDGNGIKSELDTPRRRLLPFGSGLLPTGTGRGNRLAETDFLQLQKEMHHMILDGGGVLGDVSALDLCDSFID
jgi:hypothetical protein